MREALADARQRGRSFDYAWDEGWRSIPWSNRTAQEWRTALEATREEWRAAYEGRDTVFSVAIASRDTRGDGLADFILDGKAYAA